MFYFDLGVEGISTIVTITYPAYTPPSLPSTPTDAAI